MDIAHRAARLKILSLLIRLEGPIWALLSFSRYAVRFSTEATCLILHGIPLSDAADRVVVRQPREEPPTAGSSCGKASIGCTV